jgi:hypothetical protein
MMTNDLILSTTLWVKRPTSICSFGRVADPYEPARSALSPGETVEALKAFGLSLIDIARTAQVSMEVVQTAIENGKVTSGQAKGLSLALHRYRR